MSKKLMISAMALTALAVCGLARIGAAADEDHGPRLVQATITFHTTGHSKAAETPVIVSIRHGEREIAHLDHFADDTEFKDGSDNGPYALTIERDIPRADAEHTRTFVRIDPRGYENWTFDFTVVLSFSDNTNIRRQVDHVRLTGEQREVSAGTD